MVCDYCGLNGICEPIDMFPLPRIDDLIIGQTKYLTKLDAMNGYLAVPLDKKSVSYSALVLAHGLFQWRYMAYGLKSAAATYSRTMSKLLHNCHNFARA